MLYGVIITANALASTLARISVPASTRTPHLLSAQVSHTTALTSVVRVTSSQLLKVVDTLIVEDAPGKSNLMVTHMPLTNRANSTLPVAILSCPSIRNSFS